MDGRPVTIEPIDEYSFALVLMDSGKRICVCRGQLYTRTKAEEIVRLDLPLAQQGLSVNGVKFRLFVENAEGFEFFHPDNGTKIQIHKNQHKARHVFFPKAVMRDRVSKKDYRIELDHNINQLPQLHSYRDTMHVREPDGLEPIDPIFTFRGLEREIPERTEKFQPHDSLLFAQLHRFSREKRYDQATATRNILWLFTYVFDATALADSQDPDAKLAFETLRKGMVNQEMESFEFSEDEIASIEVFLPVSRGIWQGGVDFGKAMHNEWVVESCAPMSPAYARDNAIDEGWEPAECPFENHRLNQHMRGMSDQERVKFMREQYEHPDAEQMLEQYYDLAYEWAEAVHYRYSLQESLANGEDYHNYVVDWEAVDFDQWLVEYSSSENVAPLRSLMQQIRTWYRGVKASLPERPHWLPE